MARALVIAFLASLFGGLIGCEYDEHDDADRDHDRMEDRRDDDHRDLDEHRDADRHDSDQGLTAPPDYDHTHGY